jgi:hypothetical protein
MKTRLTMILAVAVLVGFLGTGCAFLDWLSTAPASNPTGPTHGQAIGDTMTTIGNSIPMPWGKILSLIGLGVVFIARRKLERDNPNG